MIKFSLRYRTNKNSLQEGQVMAICKPVFVQFSGKRNKTGY